MKFAHIADAHIGNIQYGLQQRRLDFEYVWNQCIEKILEDEIKLLVLSGDTFHHKKPDFFDLSLIYSSLETLTEHGVQIAGIYGNHDAPSLTDKSSWLDFFVDSIYNINSTEYLSYGIPVDGIEVSINGIPWAGGRTRAKLQEYCSRKDHRPGDFNIFLMHVGVTGIIPESGLLTKQSLSPLRKHANYVALGHIHKPYTINNFAFNPGSLESNSTAEWDWKNRGMNIVHVSSPDNIKVERFVPIRRPTYDFTFSVSQLNSALDIIKSQVDKDYSLIRVTFVGSSKLQRDALKDFSKAVDELKPLHLQIQEKISVEKRNYKKTENDLDALRQVFGDDTELVLTIQNLLDEPNFEEQILDLL